MNEGDGGVFPFRTWLLTLILFPIVIGLLIYYTSIGLIEPLTAGLSIAFSSFMFFFVGIIPLWSIIEQIRHERKGKGEKQK